MSPIETARYQLSSIDEDQVEVGHQLELNSQIRVELLRRLDRLIASREEWRVALRKLEQP